MWIHSLWSTKERYPLIITTAEKKIYDLMSNEFIEAGCPVRIINGMADHVHSLFLLNPNKAVTDIIKQVKGSCSHEINKQNITKEKFAWQTGYAAYSLSESATGKVFQYIKNQKKHHEKMSFQQEYENFIRLHGFQNEEANG
jgi:REP element-mobilizing transposase RayT